MRFFDLFLRRSGISRNRIDMIPERTTSHFTIVCSSKEISTIRKKVFLNFSAVGLPIIKFKICHLRKNGLVSAGITVNCPRKLRSELYLQARILNENPAVNQLKFGKNLEC